MERSKGSRLLALVLATIMVISLAACDSSSPKSEVSTTTSNEAVTSAEAETTVAEEVAADPLGKYETPIELSYAIQSQTNQEFNPGEDYENNVWTKEIESQLGIQLKVEWMADNATDAYKNKLNLSIASGDIPDFFTGDYKTVAVAYSAGLLMDMTDLFEKYASPELKEIRDTFPEAFEASKIDGKLMALPSVTADPNITTQLLWIRTDWLENLGLSAPKTFDDVLKIAEAFVTQDPDGNGEADTVGLGLMKDLYGGIGDISGVSAAFHAYTKGMWIKDASGKIVYGAVQPEMKNALKALQDMYKNGLLDLEFGIKDTNKLVEDITQNKVGMAFGDNWNSYWPYTDVLKLDPKAIYKPYPIVSADDQPAMVGASWPVNTYYAISKDCKNPEAVIKLANLGLKIGLQGDLDPEIGFKFDIGKNNEEFYKFLPIRYAMPGSEFRTYDSIKAALDNKDGGAKLTTGARNPYDQIVAYIDKGDVGGYGTWGQLGPEGSAGVIQNEYAKKDRIVITELRGGDPEILVEKRATLEKLELEAFTKIIMGGSLDDFDEFVTDWNNLGGAEVTIAINETYGNK